LNVIDKFIATFSPQQALKREHARTKLNILNSGYSHHGASTKKKSMIGWKSGGGSAKEDIDNNVEKLRERSRDLYMGTPLATGALKTLRTNVIGSGLKLNAQIDYEYLGLTSEEAEKWESQVEREFALWADSIHCDAQQMNNFYELQQLAFFSQMMSGDCFALMPVIPRKNMPYDTRIQLIEADRVMTPEGMQYSSDKDIVGGVEVGKYGQVIAYHIAQFHPLSKDLTNKTWKRVEKFGRKTGRQNVLHLIESERPEQRRGIPVLAPVIESLKQLSRYSEAELMAAVVTGMYTIFVTSGDPEEGQPLGEMDVPEGEEVDEADEGSYDLGNGSIVQLDEGEKIQEANPSRPNTAFDGFVTAVCRQVGSALEIPYEVLMKHFTSSYSASRGALLEAWKMFKMRRNWITNSFCQPTYEEFLSEAIAKGRIEAPGFFTDPLIKKAYCGAEWIGPSQGQLDPVKEITAANKRVELGVSTRQRETAEFTGGDFTQNVRQLANEEKLMKEHLSPEGSE